MLFCALATLASLTDDPQLDEMLAPHVQFSQADEPDLRHTLRRGFARTPADGGEPGYTKDVPRRFHLPLRALGTGTEYDIPLAQHALVDTYMEYFSGRGRWVFERWLARADRYIPLMQPVLAAHGLPQDIVFLAMIESGFVAGARSFAAAVGFWQFIRSTGKLYGLAQSDWIDERHDFVRATEGACAYLSDLYRRFGDWHLAFAAYNAGEGRIGRALQKTGAATYWELVDTPGALPKETRHYVPKIIAATLLAKNRARYGFDQVQPQSPLLYDEVEVTGALDLRRLGGGIAVPLEDLRTLNPALLYDLTPPAGTYRLRVPQGLGERAAAWLAEAPEEGRLVVDRHTVQRGDTLSGIADRYGSSVDVLREFNGLANPRALRLGRTLIVPQFSRPAPPAQRHRVRAGDTLWSLGRRYNVRVADLKRWNRRKSDHLQVGEVLRVR
jgi:membrane-bound lytic murein transglycosylase D